MLMTVAQASGNRQITITQQPLPSLPKGGALVRVTGCGLCGSDVDKLHHRTLEQPLILGHEVVGVIDTLDESAAIDFPQFQVGQRVVVAHHVPCGSCHYCRCETPSMCRSFKHSNLDPGGFAQIIAITHDHLQHTTFPIPSGLSDMEASCVEPLACCLRAIDKTPHFPIPSHIAIIGMGFIGQLTAQGYQQRGDVVYGLDLNPQRIELALTHNWIRDGFDNLNTLEASLMTHTHGRGADGVFLTVVNEQTLSLAQTLVRDGGWIMMFTQTTEGLTPVNLNTLYFREIALLTSYSPSPLHLNQAFSAILHNVIQVKPLYTNQYPLQQLQEGIMRYTQGESIKVFITL